MTMKNSSFFSCRRHLETVSILWIVATFVVISVQALSAAGWTRGLPIGEVGADERKEPERFVLAVWGGYDHRDLHGVCTYSNGTSRTVILEGIETTDGDFYPKVLSQVADQKENPEWKTIATGISRAGKVVTITVEPKTASGPLKVDLDVFRPFVGKGKFGRLVLKNGEAAVFQSDDLQPPEKRTESSADFVKDKK